MCGEEPAIPPIAGDDRIILDQPNIAPAVASHAPPCTSTIIRSRVLRRRMAFVLARHRLGAVVRRSLWTGERERIEDALKHLYDCEYIGSVASIQSLAGALELSTSRVARLTERLESMGLIRAEGEGLRLTSGGRQLRLCGSFEFTACGKPIWRIEPDSRKPNGMAKPIVANTRRRRLNCGKSSARRVILRFDPHGDPIPTEKGEVPFAPRYGLKRFAAGSVGTIVHVEDEPEAIYAQLQAQNIRIDQRVTVLEKSSRRIRIEVDGEEQVMAPIVAANVCVQPVAEDAPCRAHRSTFVAGSWRISPGRWHLVRVPGTSSEDGCLTWALCPAQRSRRSCEVPHATRPAIAFEERSLRCADSKPTSCKVRTQERGARRVMKLFPSACQELSRHEGSQLVSIAVVDRTRPITSLPWRAIPTPARAPSSMH